MRSNLLSALVVVLMVGMVLVFGSPSFRQGERSVAGKDAPDFALVLNGQPARLASLKGKVVVLNFWATWCPPCVDEMPSLERLHQQIAANGAMVLGVSVDENEESYQRFLRDLKITFPNHRDPDRQIAANYGTAMYPETYIIDPQGRIARKVIGPQKWDTGEWVNALKQLAAGR